jgi:NAD(P)-dependent dehydrogenase (short-subunit alcohol dehydrogenase family)
MTGSAPGGPAAGRIMLVTGSTAGIGYHTARGLAAAGATVFLTGRDRQRGVAAAAAITLAAPHGRAEFIRADHSTVGGNQALAAEPAGRVDRLDCLVNNVGGMFLTRRVTGDGYEAGPRCRIRHRGRSQVAGRQGRRQGVRARCPRPGHGRGHAQARALTATNARAPRPDQRGDGENEWGYNVRLLAHHDDLRLVQRFFARGMVAFLSAAVGLISAPARRQRRDPRRQGRHARPDARLPGCWAPPCWEFGSWPQSAAIA